MNFLKIGCLLGLLIGGMYRSDAMAEEVCAGKEGWEQSLEVDAEAFLKNLILPSINYNDGNIIEILKFLEEKSNDILTHSESSLQLSFCTELPPPELKRKISIVESNKSVYDILLIISERHSWRVEYLGSKVTLKSL